jgi:xylan 1,4-beta-xylosidase
VEKTIDLVFRNVAANARVTIQRIDDDHGNVLKPYAAMGKPVDPTSDQVTQLNRATALPAPTEDKLTAGKLEIRLTPNSLALLKVEP